MPDLERAEFQAWRSFRERWVNCDVCRGRVRWTAPWAWVRNTHGEHVRACPDCLSESVILLPAHDLGAGR